MPRKSRISIGNIICHHMVQGINREYIFETEKDKSKYLYLLKKYHKEFEIEIIAYCIMDNHAHMILYSHEIIKISKFMQKVNSIYAKYYNSKNNRNGYVYGNRFKSVPIMTRKQLYTCIKYIHMNPVKAGIVKGEREYKYSSYNDYIYQTGFINQTILNFVFSSTNNYIQKFQSINYQDLNIDKEKGNINEFLEKFLIREKISIEKVKKDEKYLKKLVLYLNNTKYKFSKQEIAKILHIGRTTLYRKLKNETKNS